jgi:transcriptional regulator with XRE-family HTH domain
MILRKILKCWRDAEGFSLRTMATQIGIDHAALDRFERGDDLNSANLCKVVVWLLTPEKEAK